MKKYRLLWVLLLFVLSSCNKWLDVKPSSEMEREDLYSSEGGFESSLSGCYIALKGSMLYGQSLTMTTIEYLAQHWHTGNLIKGEALAMRAFCHFDILRLFGPSPKDPNKASVQLPYSEQSGKEFRPYYAYDVYCEKMLNDLHQASTLLEQVDPVMEMSFETLNNPSKLLDEYKIIDDFQAYRRLRFNYWAVKALEARIALYLGDTETAYECAKLVMDAMIYNIAKAIGAASTVLCGKMDAILLTGGIAYSDYVISHLKERIDFLAPVYVYPGEDEMEALALNALGALKGELTVQQYV